VLTLLLAMTLARLLPERATVVEARTLPRDIHPDRMLVLWVADGRKACPPGWREVWACWDYTSGCSYQGPARVSLVDTNAGRLINTLELSEPWGEDRFGVPYEVRGGGP
jgi:hypothetical protein